MIHNHKDHDFQTIVGLMQQKRLVNICAKQYLLGGYQYKDKHVNQGGTLLDLYFIYINRILIILHFICII